MATQANRDPFHLQRLRIIYRSYPRKNNGDRQADNQPTENSDTSTGNRFRDIFIPLSPIDNQPFVIGTGGFATVFVAFESQLRTGKPFAVKLLKKEQGSGSPNGRYRFIEEIYYNQLLSNTPTGAFVEYIGFGYLGGSTRQTQEAKNREASWVSRGIDIDDLESVCKENSTNIINPAFMEGHQDLFFVMKAAWCSLEQLLVSNQPLRNSNTVNLSYKRGQQSSKAGSTESDLNTPTSTDLGAAGAEINTAYGADHKNLKKDSRALGHVEDISKLLSISDSTSGLEILSAVRTNVTLGVAVSTNIQLAILQQLAAAVASIHRFQTHGSEEEQATLNLAHRDLKPANFLLDECASDSPLVVLSDLGFIAPSQSDKSIYAAFGDAREPGALPLGSVMYQAPEQMMSGREISFELIEANVLLNRWKELNRKTDDWRTVQLSGVNYLANMIRVRTVGGISIENDDRIVSTEIGLVSTGDGGRMTVRDVSLDPKSPTSAIAFIEQSIASGQTPRAEYKGLLLKPVGQQSDLFSLGCLVYFMASGGKDPSEFYRTYLRPPSGLIYLAGESSFNTCLEVATFLASRNGALAEGREVEALFSVLKGSQLKGRTKSVVAKIRSYKVSQERDHFLFSTDGTPIGISFLYIMTKLMCRGLADTYVRSLDANRATALDGCATDLKGFITELSQAISEKYHVKMGTDKFSMLSRGGGLGSLLKLRLLAPDAKTIKENAS